MNDGTSNAKIERSTSPAGRRVTVFGRWEQAFSAALAEQPFEELVLFNGKDWGDFSWLQPYRTTLRSLEVAATDDVSGLAGLEGLERLVLRAAPRKLGGFDLARFIALRELDLQWHPQYPDRLLSRLPALEQCRLLQAKVAQVGELGASTTLRSLTLDKPAALASLEGVEGCPNLEELRVGPSGKPVGLAGVQACTRLHTLRVVGPKGVTGPEALAPLAALHTLVIDGPIDRPVEATSFSNKAGLRQVALHADLAGGSVAPLLASPSLTSFALMPVSETATQLLARLDAREQAARHGLEVQAGGGKRGVLAFSRPRR